MVEFETRQCPACFMNFGVPKGFSAQRREDSKTFWCPGCGEARHFPPGGSEQDRLRRELDRAKQNQAYLDDEIRRQRERADREYKSAVALRGQVTKLKKRAAAGVCPCCNRTFAALKEHMAAKHPDFRSEDEVRENVVSLVKARTS